MCDRTLNLTGIMKIGMLLFISTLFSCYLIVSTFHRIHDSNRMIAGDGTVDCLISLENVFDESFFAYQRVPSSMFRGTHHFCRRSTWINDSLSDHFSSITFEELRRTNITGLQLYDWNAPFDVIENYLAGDKHGIFVNCSGTLWFGVNCEYTLDSMENIAEINYERFTAKELFLDQYDLYTNGTCYEMMNNSDCGSILCLDWREICDGKIDCSNGIDEYRCEELEMNQCDRSSEHRCYDGQCVDNIEKLAAIKVECSEQYAEQVSFANSCFSSENEECEDQKCRPLHFSCGDGHCYDGPSLKGTFCKTGRDRHYLERMPLSSSLILFSHIHLITKPNQTPSICFNRTLCPYISLKNTTDEIVCFHINQSSNDLVVDAKRSVRSCSLLPSMSSQCSMYRCDDQSKCFSYYRLSDGYADCGNAEDEHQLNVCSLKLPNRFTCDNGEKCIHKLLVNDGIKQCHDGTDEIVSYTADTPCENPFATNCPSFVQQGLYSSITFEKICDGINNYSPDSRNHSDESNCQVEEWPCQTERSRCDQLWNCPDGRDELGCKAETLSSLFCNNNTHFCLDMNTGEPQCLPLAKANDGKIDCLGSLDERDFCRTAYPYQPYRRYRCRNSNQCIPIFFLCNCHQNCPENDDEVEACRWHRNESDPSLMCGYFSSCDWSRPSAYDGRSDLFCDLKDIRSNFFWKVHQLDRSIAITDMSINDDYEETWDEEIDPALVWTCNRGLYVRSRKDPSEFACFCSEFYYGDRCQYQRKRIKLVLRLYMISSFNNRHSTYKFLVLLTYNDRSSNVAVVVDHHQFIYVPRFTCLPKVYVPLMYPLKEPYRYYNNYSIHIHLFDYQTSEHRAQWIFPLKFEFLPVQIIVKRLLVPEMSVSTGTSMMPIVYSSCQHMCSNYSQCFGHDVSLDRDICLCPMNFIGRRCLIPFNPCENQNCSGHGVCQPLNVLRDRHEIFQCLCHTGWYGSECEYQMAQISVSLDRNLAHLSRSMAFLHIIHPFSSDIEIPRFIYFDHSQKQTMNFTFFLSDTSKIYDGAFIQFFEHQDKYDYYYLFVHQFNEERREKFISIHLKPSHRCLSVNELFKKDMLAQPALLRVKSYQRPCREHYRNPTFCFYDDQLMCVCNKQDHQTFCFKFQTALDQCESKWCNGRGMCVQDHHRCPVHSRCICEACAYGSFCQLTTSGYSLSLESIIGSHISIATNQLAEQPTVVKVAFGLVLTIVICGILLNSVSIVTFLQPKTQEMSCGFYLLISSLVGLSTMLILLCKMVLLIHHYQNNVSCALLDYLLKSCAISCEWLNAIVAIERIAMMKRFTVSARYSSRCYAKIIGPLIIVFVTAMSLLDLLYRDMIIDPLDERAWCVLTLNRDHQQLLIFYSSWNLISFLVPLIVNLIGATFIIVGTFRLKQNIYRSVENKNDNQRSWGEHLSRMRNQINQHKHLIISPIILAVLSSTHVIIAFIFVCTKLDDNSIPSLIAYLIGYLPTMAIPIAFILPSSIYRQSLSNYIKTLLRR